MKRRILFGLLACALCALLTVPALAVGEVTRAELAQLLYENAGSPNVAGIADPGFIDMNASDAYYNAVKWAADKGLMNGYPDGSYLPNGTIQRGELAYIIDSYTAVKTPKNTINRSILRFDDLNETLWYSSYIDDMYEVYTKGVFGILGNQFGPEVSATRGNAYDFIDLAGGGGAVHATVTSLEISRAELVQALYENEGMPSVTGLSDPGYDDVAPTAAYYDALIWAFNNNIITGVPDGGLYVFQPNGSVTRAQFVIVLVRYMDNSGKSLSGAPDMYSGIVFDDLITLHWAFASIKKMYELGIISGITANTFDQGGLVLKTDVEALLQQFFPVVPPYIPGPGTGTGSGTGSESKTEPDEPTDGDTDTAPPPLVESIPRETIEASAVSSEVAEAAAEAVRKVAELAAETSGAVITAVGDAVAVAVVAPESESADPADAPADTPADTPVDTPVDTVVTLIMPDSIDTAKITTMAILNEDGTLTPIPTRIDADGNVVILISGSATLVPLHVEANFTDVYFGELYAHVTDEINRAASLMIINGRGNSIFDPVSEVTSQEAVTMFLRAMGVEVQYETAMNTAVQHGLVIEDTEAGAPMTRTETAALIVNALRDAGMKPTMTLEEAKEATAPFSDLKGLTDDDLISMAICIELGIFKGAGEGIMNPDGVLQRSQMASLAVRLQDVMLGM